MQRTLIVNALASEAPQRQITVCGWIRTRRDAKDFSFVEINDGSCLTNMQCIVDAGTAAHEGLGDANTGASVAVTGELVASPGKGQKWEVRAESIRVFGLADPESFPLQKKRHSDEFLRGIAHLRMRTNKYGAAFRIRSEAARAVHDYFHSQHFSWVHTPILTGSDCEGAGEMFRVTALPAGEKDLSKDFFGRQANLTVSGQLEAEALALGLGRVYTFGPTFRAENSNTTRHAAEFWMIEPEMAFAELEDIMELGEGLTRHVVDHALTRCESDLKLFDNFVDKGLIDRLKGMLAQPFCPRVLPGKPSTSWKTAARSSPSPWPSAWTCRPSTSASWPKNTSAVPSSSMTIPRRSKPSTCAAMTTARPWRPWTCWCPASASSSAVPSVKSAWTSCWPASPRWARSPRTTGGIWICAASAACPTPVSAWASNAC